MSLFWGLQIIMGGTNVIRMSETTNKKAKPTDINATHMFRAAANNHPGEDMYSLGCGTSVEVDVHKSGHVNVCILSRMIVDADDGERCFSIVDDRVPVGGTVEEIDGMIAALKEARKLASGKQCENMKVRNSR